MAERASLVTEEAVDAAMDGIGVGEEWKPYYRDVLTVALQAAEPHLLNAFKERLLSDEGLQAGADAAHAHPEEVRTAIEFALEAALDTLPWEGEGSE